MSAIDLPEGFIYLKDVAPDIRQDLKYASLDNFTQKKVEGYNDNNAILTKQAAEALLLVEKELNKKGYGLIVFDAYRPKKAVNSFLKWKDLPDVPEIKEKYYPNITKEEIFKREFIVQDSSHCRGSTVDVGVVELETEKELDMGTIFDFFGKKSNTDFKYLNSIIKKNRKMLKKAMEKNGFENLILEWWHYTLKDEPFKEESFDFNY